MGGSRDLGEPRTFRVSNQDRGVSTSMMEALETDSAYLNRQRKLVGGLVDVLCVVLHPSRARLSVDGSKLCTVEGRVELPGRV